jgi:hypothetical protein
VLLYLALAIVLTSLGGVMPMGMIGNILGSAAVVFASFVTNVAASEVAPG